MKDRKTKVLVVDDDPSITTIIESYLYVKNIDIIAVNAVFDAIEILKTQEFDLILSDVNMPNINGFEFLLWLKKNNIKSHIVIMTAQANEKAKEVYHNYGILKYLSKPIELSKLLELINQIDDSGFSSTIKDITLFDYIQIMSLSKKTNALCIESLLLDFKSYLYFKDGEIIEAEFGEEKGEDAFFKIIKINGGIITEIEKEILSEGTIKIPSMSLLFKATQIIDEENVKNKKIENSKYSILFIEDKVSTLNKIKDHLIKKYDIEAKIVQSEQDSITSIQQKFFDLIICDIIALENNGTNFFTKINQNSISSKILLLIEQDIKDLKNVLPLISDTVGYIVKPINIIELDKMIEADIKSGFSGDINNITLFDYIQMIALSKKTKTVLISSPLTYSEGVVYIENGNVIHARYENLSGTEALFKIMTISGGSIRELDNKNKVEPTIKLSLPSLLMKATGYIEQENIKKMNVNIDQKIIDSIDTKLKNLSDSITKSNLQTIQSNEIITMPNTIQPKHDPLINKSAFIKNQQEIQDNNIINPPISQPFMERTNSPSQFSLLSLKRKVVSKSNSLKDSNVYLKTFESLRFLIPSLSEKGEKAVGNPSTDMATYQMLKKIEGTINVDIIYQTYYHHLDLFDFFTKFELIINLVNFKEINKDNIKTNIFQILLFTKLISKESLSFAIESYLKEPNHSDKDRDFLDGSFLVDLGSLTNQELTKSSLFVNKFNKFIDHI